MSKEILFMRHAKSSWDHPGLNDHERPLNARGERDAPRMAEWLNRQSCVPDRILASDAHRAWSTAQRLVEYLVPTPPLEPRPEFYLAEPETWFEAVQFLPEPDRRVLLIGHNPGLEDVVERLSGQYHRFPTATIAHFELAIESWESFDPRQTDRIRLLNLWRPKEIEA